MLFVTEKEKCCGCHACLNACPQNNLRMAVDREGFWYPEAMDGQCANCGLCEKVCPILHKKEIKTRPKAYACYNKDDTVRLKSSSGGIFHLLAQRVLEDGGIVFGAGYDKDLLVSHMYIEKQEDLGKLQGSKYVQSKIAEQYKKAKQFLLQGRTVLFAGTPCQIAGLKSYLIKDYPNLYCVDIICHGVPSPNVWRKYLSYLETKAKAAAKGVSFRSKDQGWKRYKISVSFENGGNYLQFFDKDLYMRAFLKNISLRPSCYSCAFKTLQRQSDITLADFWGIQTVLPEMDDDRGTSLVFVSSDRGAELFNAVKQFVVLKETEPDRAVLYNTAAVKPVEKHPNRERFFERIDDDPFDKLMRRYCAESVLAVKTKQVEAVLKRALKKTGLVAAVKRAKQKIKG